MSTVNTNVPACDTLHAQRVNERVFVQNIHSQFDSTSTLEIGCFIRWDRRTPLTSTGSVMGVTGHFLYGDGDVIYYIWCIYSIHGLPNPS